MPVTAPVLPPMEVVIMWTGSVLIVMAPTGYGNARASRIYLVKKDFSW
jgi:hypothetical protein